MPHGTMPAISVIEAKPGSGFSARVTWPDGKTQDAGYFRNRSEAQRWLVNDSDAWIASHRAEYTRPDHAADAAAALTYDSLPPGNAAFDGIFPVLAVERLDFDRC